MIARIIKLCVASLTIFILYLALKYLNYLRLRRINECKEPPRYAHKDPVFGLDLFLRMSKAVKDDNFLTESSKLHQSNGTTFQTISTGKRAIYTIDPENLKTIFVTDFSKWGVSPSRLGALGPFFGKGFMTVDGSLWHRSRKMFFPLLDKQVISNLTDIENFTTNLMSHIPANGVMIDMQPLLSSLYVNVTTRFLFGEAFGDRSDSTSAADITKDFDDALRGGYLRIALGSLRFLAYNANWLAACKRTQDFADSYVDQALRLRHAFKFGNEQQNSNKNSLLHSLAQQTDDRLQMRNDILQAFSASRETTANLLVKVIFIASRSSATWAKLREEALSIAPVGITPTYEQLKHLPYLRLVMNEALRLYPVIPNNKRTALVDTVLPKGGGTDGKSPIFIKAGTQVNISYYALQRYPDFWGEDASEINMDRWDYAGDTSFKYLPFGAGPRSCIGRDKALTEASFVLVKLLQRYRRLESRDAREWRGRIAISAESVHGCKVAFLE